MPLSVIVGMLLLAGHLQIAFYGLLAGSLWAVGLLVVRTRRYGTGYGARFLGVCVAGLVLGGMLALPQILPTLELSRLSHRQGKPSAGGYALYVEYGLPSADLVMLALPEFFGSDVNADNPYYGFYTKRLPDGREIAIRHNAAETAVYVGILPLLLALLAVIRQFTRRKASDNRRGYDLRVLFFAGLGALALLLALGNAAQRPVLLPDTRLRAIGVARPVSGAVGAGRVRAGRVRAGQPAREAADKARDRSGTRRVRFRVCRRHQSGVAGITR